MRELARELGVSHAAVSFALNGRPGVSPATRERIIAGARERGWAPNIAARALGGHGTGSVGLVLARSADALAADSFYLRFIAGLQSELSPLDLTLTFQIADDVDSEIALHRRWAAQARVDGLIVVDPRTDDPRLHELHALGLPAVIVGAREHAAAGIALVWADDEQPMTEVVRTFAELGHRRIGYVAGAEDLVHTASRVRSFASAIARYGRDALPVVHTHHDPDEAERAVAALLDGGPTAVIADDDRLAVTVLSVAKSLGIEVPRDLSIVSWEDSPLCTATTPPLTALWRDPFDLGRSAAAALLAEISDHRAAAIAVAPAVLRRRESLTAAP
jgi:DNA-binding LacI/PurR family transcriptional regulator